jgi:hypothetical protein
MNDCDTEEKNTISEPMVRNLLTKLFHAFLLYSVPIENLYQFYNTISTRNPEMDGGQLVIHLWHENGFTPSRYVNNLLKNAELLCVKHNIHMYQKFKDFIRIALSSEAFQTQIYGPVLKFLSGEIDIRRNVFRAVSSIAASVFLNSSCKIISESVSKKVHENKFIIRQLHRNDDRSCAIDIELSFIFLAQIVPVMFFLRPFSQHRIYFHEQRVEDLLLDRESMCFKMGKLYINGQSYGRQKSFWECDTGNLQDEMSLTDYGIWQVTCIEKDYVCPIRRRVILKHGEVYGAPYSVVSISDIVQEPSMGRYEVFIQDDNNNDLWSELEKKQQLLLGMYNKTVKIVYDKLDQILIVNNISVIGGVQAKIFSTILKLFINKKRNIFEWRDLAANDELICDPYSTGLSTRLSRLIDTLKRRECGCTIEKMARGKYKLICNHEIEYTEKS